MNPILLIHGFGGTPFQYKPIKKALVGHKFYEFTYSERYGSVSLSNICENLLDYAKKNIKEKKINIIGFSQGGLIARCFISKTALKVEKCFTICTPHNGSLLAYLSKSKGFLDLRPGSDFIKSLDKKTNTQFYSVYNPLDLMVVPGWSARMKGSECKMVMSPLHQLTWWLKPTLTFIQEKL